MVDLIPPEYHRNLRVQRLLRRFGLAAFALAAAVVAAGAGLAYGISGERTALARFKHMQAQAKAQQARLTEVTARRDQAREQIQALDTLRGGAVVGPLATAIDAALIDRIWFQELVFSRGEPGERKTDLAAAKAGAAAKEATTVARPASGAHTAAHAEIRGVAGDHAALAEFVMKLAAQPGVGQAKLIDTSARTHNGVPVVDFRLALLLEAAPGATQ